MRQGLFTQYALRFVGAPYRFGSNGPIAWDCSSFVLELLKALGANPTKRDMTAQDIHDWASSMASSSAMQAKAGTLVFYGRSLALVTHVAMLLSPGFLIEAGGGDATTRTLQDAENRGWAMVRVRPFGHRPDYLTHINLHLVLDD